MEGWIWLRQDEKDQARIKVQPGISAKSADYINIAEYFMGYLHTFQQNREFLLLPLMFSQNSAQKIKQKVSLCRFSLKPSRNPVRKIKRKAS